MVHLFCDCEKVVPIWRYIINIIEKHINNFKLSNFEKLFGLSTDKFIAHIVLVVKYYIYICKFRSESPNVDLFKSFIKKQKEIEYYLAKKSIKLTLHFF